MHNYNNSNNIIVQHNFKIENHWNHWTNWKPLYKSLKLNKLDVIIHYINYIFFRKFFYWIFQRVNWFRNYTNHEYIYKMYWLGFYSGIFPLTWINNLYQYWHNSFEMIFTTEIFLQVIDFKKQTYRYFGYIYPPNQ